MNILIVVAIFTKYFIETTALQCYQCYVNPPPGHYYNTTALCTKFNYSYEYIVECPHSTMCMKRTFNLDIQNQVKIQGTERSCAPQQFKYHALENGQWHPRAEIQEPYSEGCEDTVDGGERSSSSRYCYCRSNLCNASPKTSSEGYTDIMGVIVVFNLMKYINSIR